MNIIAFIAARSGSKSIPDKNIKLLGGKPLLVWSIESAFKAGIQRVIVNSDSEDYLKIAQESGAETMLRLVDLAQDTTSMFELLKTEIPKIEPLPEIVIILSPTAPLREVTHIKAALSFFTANMNTYDSLMSVRKVPEEFNPAQVLITTSLGIRMANGTPLSNRITRRQEYPDAYVTTSGIYIFKTTNLESGSFYGKNTMLLEVEPNPDINSLEDWAKAELWLQKSSQK